MLFVLVLIFGWGIYLLLKQACLLFIIGALHAPKSLFILYIIRYSFIFFVASVIQHICPINFGVITVTSFLTLPCPSIIFLITAKHFYSLLYSGQA